MLPARQRRYLPQAASANAARLLSALISFQRPIIESTLASSARFPCLHVRSRNQSPPSRNNPISLAHVTGTAADGAPRGPEPVGGAGAGLVAEGGGLAGGQ